MAINNIRRSNLATMRKDKVPISRLRLAHRIRRQRIMAMTIRVNPAALLHPEAALVSADGT